LQDVGEVGGGSLPVGRLLALTRELVAGHRQVERGAVGLVEPGKLLAERREGLDRVGELPRLQLADAEIVRRLAGPRVLRVVLEECLPSHGGLVVKAVVLQGRGRVEVANGGRVGLLGGVGRPGSRQGQGQGQTRHHRPGDKSRRHPRPPLQGDHWKLPADRVSAGE
jgi:hypothetical protein